MIQDYPSHHESFAPGRQSPRVTAAIPECEERPSLVIEGVGGGSTWGAALIDF